MSRIRSKLKTKTPSFQSDIVINEDGDILISFFGAELLHLIDTRRSVFRPIQDWVLPEFKQSYYLNQLEDIKKQYTSCLMCPKECGFDRVKSAHPNCGDWQIKVSNYGISFGDEAEICNGGGSGVIFLSGCPLTCPSCINNEKVRNDGTPLTIHEFLQLAENLQKKGANNIQILSPTVNLPHLRFALKILKESSFPLPIILKSSGYESVSELKKFKGLVDIYIPDYKFSTSCYWKKQSGADDYQAVFEKCLEEMYSQLGPIVRDENGNIINGVIIRHVKNPYLSKSENELIEHFLKSQPQDIFISILDNFVVLD
jgi:putative pyruvate formate lyase activating enzyme